MTWSDKELDEIFMEASASKTVEYKASYFNDIAQQLPIKKSKKVGFWIYNIFGIAFILTAIFHITLKQEKVEDFANIKSQKNIVAELNNVKNPIIEGTAHTNNQVVESKEINASHKGFTSSITTQKNSNLKQNKKQFNKEIYAKNSKNIGIISEYKVDTQSINTLQAENINSEIEKTILTDSNTDSTKIELIENKSTVLLTQEVEQVAEAELLAKQFNVPRNQIFFELNGNMGQSPIEVKGLNSTSSGLAINFGYQFTKKTWGILAGIGVKKQFYSNVNIKERTYIYGFGVNTFDQNYQFKSTFNLNVPIEIVKYFKQHQISLGLNTSIPISAHISSEKYLDGKEVKSSNGYLKSSEFFKPMNLESTLGYRFQITKNWSIGAKFGMNLYNPIKTDRFQGDLVAPTFNGQMSLRFNIPF